ncbi:hypothetical protein G9A89_014370 [Geosiphon pyriformis]|nr:hypothetical protein G9A89_014370 [Geosiphon pyriformis]
MAIDNVMRNTSGNCKDSLREDPRQWVDFSSASEKEYINTHNNQESKNNLHHNSKKKAFSITEKTKVATKTPNLTVLEFCHAIYTQNQSDLELPERCCPVESALTYYINARINYHIGKEEEPHDAKLGLYRELSQYTTKEVAVIAATIVKIHREIEQYANKNFPISTGNTRECANKTKENLETNQESNQQKLGTPAQTPKKTVTQSIKKQCIYSPEDKSYYFLPENKIQIPLGAASSSTLTPQMPRTPSYTDKIKQRNWKDIPITGGYSSLFQNPLFQPKFRTGFENREEESESESEKKTSEKTITRPVTETSSQSRNQETHNQEEEPDIREATFRNAQENIIPLSLRPINPPIENGNEITTPYIARLTDFSREEEETDMHTWLREAQKAIQANNWNDQRAIQTLLFFLKDTADSWYQSLETKPTSFAEFKNALLKYFNNPNAIEAIEQGYYTDPQVLNQFIKGLKSSILGRVRPAHSNSLPEAVMLARALELAEKEANHSQMVNMVMEKNKTETLKKRVTQLGEELSNKIESYLIPDLKKNTYQPPQRCSQEVSNSRNNCSSRQEFRTGTRACHFCKCEACKNNYYVPQMPRNQYTPIPRQYPTTYQNQGAYQQQLMIANPNWRSEARNQPMWNQNATNQQTNPNYQNYQQTYLNILENLIIGNNDDKNINRTKNSSKLSQTTTPICTTSPVHSTTTPELLSTTTNDTSNLSLSNFSLHLMENQSFDKSTSMKERDVEQTSKPFKQTKSNIPPATIIKDTTLAMIFPFDIDNLNTHSLFSGAAINQDKPIMALYTNARVREINIKLILNSRLAGSIIPKQLIDQLADRNTKTPIEKIDNFLFEINRIQIPIKVLVMEIIQYQALNFNSCSTDSMPESQLCVDTLKPNISRNPLLNLKTYHYY